MADNWIISGGTALKFMPQDYTDDESILVQVMVWCLQATNHYMIQCWPRCMTRYTLGHNVTIGLLASWRFSAYLSRHPKPLVWLARFAHIRYHGPIVCLFGFKSTPDSIFTAQQCKCSPVIYHCHLWCVLGYHPRGGSVILLKFRIDRTIIF